MFICYCMLCFYFIACYVYMLVDAMFICYCILCLYVIACCLYVIACYVYMSLHAMFMLLHAMFICTITSLMSKLVKDDLKQLL